jgi:multisubunit Na+/H+ antiporter MnhF subunit
MNFEQENKVLVDFIIITNLLGFIGSYNFYVKFNFHRFIQKSHEFYAMVNMNKICTCSIS